MSVCKTNKKHKDHHNNNNNMSKFNFKFNPSLHMLLVYYAEWSQDGADFSLQSGRDTDQTENWEWKSESYTRPVQIQKYIYIYMHLFSFSLKLQTDSLLSSLNKTKLADQSKQTKIMAFVFFFLTDKNEGFVFFFLVFFFKKRKVHEQQFAGFLIAQMYRALPSVMTG